MLRVLLASSWWCACACWAASSLNLSATHNCPSLSAPHVPWPALRMSNKCTCCPRGTPQEKRTTPLWFAAFKLFVDALQLLTLMLWYQVTVAPCMRS